MTYLFFLLYRYLLMPSATFLLSNLYFLFPEKIRSMVRERNETRFPVVTARPIWIHASSGEIEYAKPVIRLIKEKWPHIPIFVTYFSPSAKKLIKNTPGIDYSFPLPFDEKMRVKKFLTQLNPLACLIARTDVWPEFAHQTQIRGIPSLLFSATLADDSSRKGLLSKQFTRKACSSLDTIFCVSENDLKNFSDINVTSPLEVSGDTRYDQVINRLQNPKELKSSLKPSAEAFTFVAGSTWPQDENELFPSVETLFHYNFKFILAPHEVSESRLLGIENYWKSKNIRIDRYTNATTNWQILLIDQIGILPEVYTWADAAFVGGSFKDRIHSVMEPLAAGLKVLVGPFHQNNREALHFQNVLLQGGQQAVTVISSAAEITETLSNWMNSEAPTTRQELQDKVQALSGSSHRVIKWLTPKIGPRSI